MFQHVLDHMRTQMCITNVGRNFRQLVFGPMMNFFNLYEFMNMLSYFIEWPQGGLKIGTHIRMLRFIFPCNMAARDESERERIFGTGGWKSLMILLMITFSIIEVCFPLFLVTCSGPLICMFN